MQNNPNQLAKDAWDANAEVWDSRMGDEGNDFFNVLCWPVLASFLDASTSGQTGTAPPLSAEPLKGKQILDIACGNGLTSRRLAALGAKVTAFDFSANLIEKAKSRPNPENRISYHVVDATDKEQLFALGERKFESALSNMALFDMENIEVLFQTLPRLLKPNGVFVFSITHPCFNNSSANHLVEEWDDGTIQTRYALKISRYMTNYQAEGLALRGQPKPQLYFNRPLQYYMNIGFQNGFVVDAFEERAFPPEHPQASPLGWGGKFSEIPPVLVVRMRLIS
jgi:2-polyprenyl-3-methyl-5-hydroxy-6-metoxy-1,4-benzoquinol methylase